MLRIRIRSDQYLTLGFTVLNNNKVLNSFKQFQTTTANISDDFVYLNRLFFKRKVSEFFQDLKSIFTGHLHLEISDPTNKGPDPQH